MNDNNNLSVNTIKKDYTVNEAIDVCKAAKLIDKPKITKVIRCCNQKGQYTGISFETWVKNNALVLSMTDDSIRSYGNASKQVPTFVEIPFNAIEYYSIEGEEYIEQNIHGGGSTGINVGGALVGGVLFGAAGAVLMGSRKTKEVQTTTTHIDTRVLIFRYFNPNGERQFAFFNKDDWDNLHDLLPQYEKDIVVRVKQNELVNGTKTTLISESSKKVEDDIETQLEKIKRLLDKELITQEEYNEKKKQILSNL